MIRRLEPAIWIGILILLAALTLLEGRRHEALAAEVPLAPVELYRALARSKSALQIVDIRPELAEGYEDTHIPGAIPFPSCDPAKTPLVARARIIRSVPSVIVSAGEESAADLERCRRMFPHARRLAGGMDAWSAAKLPEDSGEYVPPSATVGGGCL